MDREKVIKGLECHRIDNNHRINCADCPYYVDDDNYIRCVNNLHDDALAMLKEHGEREKAICKEICDFIRGSCSTDTDADKDYVCHEIQKMFIWS